MKFCQHTPHTVINWIKDPKWSTHEVLIDKDAVDLGEENVLICFTNPSARKKYGWFHYRKSVIQQHPTQPNGRIKVYVVPLSKRKPFAPIKDCDCENTKLL